MRPSALWRPAPPGAPILRGLALAGIAVALGGLLLLMAPVLAHPTTLLLGSPDSEGPGHVSALAISLMGTTHGGPWVLSELPGALNPVRANIAPQATLLGWPVFMSFGKDLSAVALAWNLQWLLLSAAGVYGTALFLRDWLGNAAVAALGASVVACAAALHQLPDVGRLEELTLYGWPLHVALLYRAIVRRPGVLAAALAALSFAALAVDGGLSCLTLAAAEIPLALAFTWASPRRGYATGVLLFVAAAGALAVWPFVAAHLAFPSPPQLHPHRGRTIVGLAQLLPGGAAIPFTQGYHVRPYPGVLTLGLAAFAAVVDRRARPWLLAALVLLVFALGPALRWLPDGEDLCRLPAAFIGELVPSLPMTAWNRIGALLVPLLVFTAAPIVVRWPWLGLLWLVAAGEHLLEGGSSAKTHAWSLAADPVLLNEVHRGGVLIFPQDDVTMTWQHLGRAGMPAAPVTLGPVRLVQWLDALAPTPVVSMRPGDLPGETPSPGCVAYGAELLRSNGYRFVVTRPAGIDADSEGQIEAALTPVLGPPQTVGSVRAWPTSASIPSEPCAAVDVHRGKRAGGGRSKRR